MSELTNTRANRTNLRRQLLTTASALALIASACGSGTARAGDGDADRPVVWIELGGQFEHLSDGEDKFVPPFLLAAQRPAPQTVDPLSIGHPPRTSYSEEGKISFQPEDSNWVFSAGIRVGRTSSHQGLNQQSYPTKGIPVAQYVSKPGVPITPGEAIQNRKALQFVDAQRQDHESHMILDFQAGKDVGLGMFGAGSSSIFSLGVRFAQFGSKSNIAFASDPDAHPTYIYFGNIKVFYGGIYHLNDASLAAARSFHGIGPSISWNASAPVVGNPADGEIALDWGANAALLFGRQRANVHHQTTAQYHMGKYPYASVARTTLYRHTPPDRIRSRSVTVPNIGGFAGLSFRYANAKLSLGYRGDFFFGAMDGGIDTAKKENRSFYGPFASVSIGLGG
ncbi:MAG TPA: hypothetical protein VIJ62_00830 [Rhizomicrobium sp.]